MARAAISATGASVTQDWTVLATVSPATSQRLQEVAVEVKNTGTANAMLGIQLAYRLHSSGRWGYASQEIGDGSTVLSGPVVLTGHAGREPVALAAGESVHLFWVVNRAVSDVRIEARSQSGTVTAAIHGLYEYAVSPDVSDWSVDDLAVGGTLTMTAIPAADPGVPGQLYHTAGAVMVSL